MSNTMDEAILVYDINTVPYGLTMEQVMEIFKKQRVVVYDSTIVRTGKDVKPTIFALPTGLIFKTIDTRQLSIKEIAELTGNIQKAYEQEKEEEFPDVCNMDGKIVSKYVYYVRKILFVIAPMSGEYMNDFNKAKGDIRFPKLTGEQLVSLRIEELNSKIVR